MDLWYSCTIPLKHWYKVNGKVYIFQNKYLLDLFFWSACPGALLDCLLCRIRWRWYIITPSKSKEIRTKITRGMRRSFWIFSSLDSAFTINNRKFRLLLWWFGDLNSLFDFTFVGMQYFYAMNWSNKAIKHKFTSGFDYI